ncbi:hypothetical protein [Occallatibacter savannae]|uniref:hypothetical protein n=1 Tax=Occallatibacter savannae TaxID=1002691 RepID=UPI0013A58186|nr:hypothetical protein [Occallatibacter savannae]
MDRLLMDRMRAPVPALSSNFERKIVRAAKRDSDLLGRYRWIVFAAYVVASALTSLAIMHNAGLGWLPIVGILAAATVGSAAFVAWKTGRAAVARSEA